MWSYFKIPNWFLEAQKYFAQIIRKAACTVLLKQSNYSKHTSFYTHFYNCSQVTGAKQACHIGACSQMLHQVPPLVLELLVVVPSLHHCSLQTAHQLIFQIRPEISFVTWYRIEKNKREYKKGGKYGDMWTSPILDPVSSSYAPAFPRPAFWTKYSILLINISCKSPGFTICWLRCLQLNVVKVSQAQTTIPAISRYLFASLTLGTVYQALFIHVSSCGILPALYLIIYWMIKQICR
jgi:hypothetical protein